MKRVVVTGIGVLSPVGSELETVWKNLTSGVSGIRPIEGFDCSDFSVQIAGEVIGLDIDEYIPKKEQRRMDLYARYGLACARQAVENSGLDMNTENPERIGVVVGSGIGGLQTLQIQHSTLKDKGPSRCSPFMIPQMISNMAAGLIAIQHNMKGPNYAVVSACATAAHSIGDAMRMVQRGDADVMLAGGAEASVCELAVAGFSNMKALSTRNDDPARASRPFDRERDGFVIAEGAGILVLEELEHARQRNAHIYCEVGGVGMTCDAYHMTAPVESGEGAARAMKIAVEDSGLNLDDVDYINAHGTSTPLNDKTETQAIKTAFGEDRARKLSISSTKSMTGHMLGAAAGIESAACALAIERGVIPPTVNQEVPDPDCDLDYVPNTAREAKVDVCLNTSLGFGGHNACLLFKSLD